MRYSEPGIYRAETRFGELVEISEFSKPSADTGKFVHAAVKKISKIKNTNRDGPPVGERTYRVVGPPGVRLAGRRAKSQERTWRENGAVGARPKSTTGGGGRRRRTAPSGPQKLVRTCPLGDGRRSLPEPNTRTKKKRKIRMRNAVRQTRNRRRTSSGERANVRGRRPYHGRPVRSDVGCAIGR